MASVTTGAGATIVSDTAEGQLFHAALLLQHYEGDLARNPEKRDYIQCNFNHNKLLFSANFNFPCAQQIAPSGRPCYAARKYLDDSGFTPGSGGTFVSTDLPSFILEVLAFCQILEGDLSTNPTKANNISYVYGGDTGIVSGSLAVPYIFNLQGGKITMVPTEYLVNP